MNNAGRAVAISEGNKSKPYRATWASHPVKLLISLIALVVMLLVSIASAQAKTITLSWGASAGIIAGYRLYYGQTSQSYPSSLPSAPSLITTTTYTTPDLPDGTYYFVVRAFDLNGKSSGNSNEVAATISSAAPAANFSATPTKGTTPLTVKFTSSSTGSIDSYSWNFGDNTTSTAQNPTKIYSNVGTYSVKLTVIGSGKSNTVTKTNYISVSAPTTTAPVASFTARPTSGGTPLLVTFTDTSTGGVTSRLWNFGDGTTSTNQTYVKTYNTPGSYTAKLTVGNAKGSSTTSKTISATAVAPAASFSATPRTGVAPLSTSFTNTSSGTITSYSWNFGDGSTSTASNPAHSYATAGTYTVSLTAKGPAGTNTKTQTSYITVSKATGANGLVAAYNFNESQGTTVVDKSGKGNHGVISGAVRSSGKFGNSLSFDGSNDWVKINDASSLDLTTSVTVEAWVYPDELRSGWWYCVLAKDVQGGAAYYLAANSDLNNPEFGIKTEDWKWNALHGGPSLRQATSWVHLAATYDGATQRLYVNGTQVSSRAQSGQMMVSSSPLYIGRSGVWSEYFKGRIDEVRIYNRALSASEIKADMNTPVP